MHCIAIAVSLSVLFIAAGITMLEVVPKIVHEAIRSTFQIAGPASSVYQDFLNSSAKGVHVYKDVYLFSVTNPDTVLAGGVPHVVTLGPYVYREFETYNESEIRWLPNGTMRYKAYRLYTYVPEKSLGDPHKDSVTMPSFGMQVLMKMIRRASAHDSLSSKELLDALADIVAVLLINKNKTEPFFTTQPAHNWIRGYHDPLLDGIARVAKASDPNVGFLMDNTPESYDAQGLNEAYTGGQGSSSLPPVPPNSYRSMTMWNGMHNLTYWGSEYANTIRGTDGTVFPPLQGNLDNFPVFVSTLYRSALIHYTGGVSIKGIPCNRHVIKKSEMEPASRNPQNAPFYIAVKGFVPAPPSVVTHPFVISKPYFLDADTSVVHLQDFPPPDPAKHDTFLDVEPLTGSLMHAHKRLQANFNYTFLNFSAALSGLCQLFKNSEICQMNNVTWFDAGKVRSNIFPAFWIDQHMTVPDSLAQKFKNEIQLPLFLSQLLGGMSIALGGVLGIVTGIRRFLAGRHSEKSPYNVNEEERRPIVSGDISSY